MTHIVPRIDPRKLRAAFGTFLTGVTVVTTTSKSGLPVGFTANSFTSVSMDPPLILVCPAKSLQSYPIFNDCAHFAINILSEDQQAISNIFASATEDRFSQISWKNNAQGCPLIDGATTTLSCETHNRVEAGDHILLIGEVTAYFSTFETGLGYCNKGYFSAGLERRAEALSNQSHPVTVGAIVEHDGAVLLSEVGGVYYPPEISAERTGSVASVEKLFQDNNLSVELGPVYSIFDHSITAEICTYYLGNSGDGQTGRLGKFIPVNQLESLKYKDSAVETMMHRYTSERNLGLFGLYVGDETSGDVHLFGEN